MANPQEELKQLAAQMGKKGTFIPAANKLASMIQTSYKSSDAALKEEFFATTKRAAHLLRSSSRQQREKQPSAKVRRSGWSSQLQVPNAI
eukprot:3373787-Rhodomonas_salina.1